MTVDTPWRIAMATSIGTSHIAATQRCQDSHAHVVLKDTTGRSVVVLVASDGAGSASVADIGSSLACETFIWLVEEFFSSGGRVEQIGRSLIERWIAGILYRFSLHAETHTLTMQDYACTLLAAITTEGATAFVQIGDGAIVFSRGSAGDWSYAFWPQHGEFANTTNFITSDAVGEVLDFRSTDETIDEIAIFTDGIENLVLRKAEKAVHAPFFDSMFRAVRQSTASGIDETLCRELEKYLSTPPITQRTHDDKTLILASRRPASSDVPP